MFLLNVGIWGYLSQRFNLGRVDHEKLDYGSIFHTCDFGDVENASSRNKDMIPFRQIARVTIPPQKQGIVKRNCWEISNASPVPETNHTLEMQTTCRNIQTCCQNVRVITIGMTFDPRGTLLHPTKSQSLA